MSRTGKIGTKEERAAERRSIARQEMRRARRQILITGRSGKCSGFGDGRDAEHAGQVGGCANDGSTCICECHDPAGSSGSSSGSTS